MVRRSDKSHDVREPDRRQLQRDAFLRDLHSWASPGTCATNFERMGAYTIVRTYHNLWILVLASAVFSAISGVSIAGWAGIYTTVALLGAFSTIFAIISVARIHIHIHTIAALTILPGVVIDYVLHLLYDKSALRAVCFSCLTSAGGFVPYLFSSTAGIRDFTLVFIVGTVSGLVFAIAAVSIKTVKYDPVVLRDAAEVLSAPSVG